MEFGRIEYDGLRIESFNLKDVKQKYLFNKKNTNCKIYIGLDRWGRKEWQGKIFPKGTRENKYLEFYIKYFNSIELTTTHYQVYPSDAISKWAEKAKGKDFLFCPKVPQIISHYSGFNNVDTITNKFLEGVLAFNENLGPIFLQVGDRYSPDQRDKLFDYLQSLPIDLQFFLEVRHPDWFSDKIINKELFDTLNRLNIGAVITDTPARRDVTHMTLTVPKVFVRFLGLGYTEIDNLRIQQWKNKISSWIDQGLEECYFFIHTYSWQSTIEFSKYVQEQLKF